MSTEEKKEGEEAAVAKPKSKKKLFIIVGVVVVILCAGIPVLFLGGGEEEAKDEHAAEAEEVKHLVTVALDPIIVNLSTNAAFLKVSMILEYDAGILDKAALEAAGHGEGGGHGGGASGGGGEAEGGGMHPIMTARQPMIKDVILRILSSKKPEEVLTTEGKEKLKEELIEGINEAIGLEEEPIVNIYFTEFMVQ